MSQHDRKCGCSYDELECGDYVDVVFENGRVISGKIRDIDYEELTLTIGTRCGKCVFINGGYVMYICKECNRDQDCR